MSSPTGRVLNLLIFMLNPDQSISSVGHSFLVIERKRQIYDQHRRRDHRQFDATGQPFRLTGKGWRGSWDVSCG